MNQGWLNKALGQVASATDTAVGAGENWRRDGQLLELADSVERLCGERAALEAELESARADVSDAEERADVVEVAKLAGSATTHDLRQARQALQTARERVVNAEKALGDNERRHRLTGEAVEARKRLLQVEAVAAPLAEFRRAIKQGDRLLTEADKAFARARALASEIDRSLDVVGPDVAPILGVTPDVFLLAHVDEIREDLPGGGGGRRGWRALARRYGCID